MEISVVETGAKRKAVIEPVEDGEYKLLTKKRYHFPWKGWKGKADLFKLCISGDEDILGVMALIDVPGDKRIEIKLLAVSVENTGNKKKYEGIAGCLIAYACREAVKKYADQACVSLVPKTKLKAHYLDKYNMIDGGKQIFLEGKPLMNIVIKYLV
jgi:hypothetical protein